MPTVPHARRAEQLEVRRTAHARLVGGGVLAVPEALPIAACSDALIAAIAEHQVIVVAGETGSGKSTQLPKLCLAAGRGEAGLIGHTQPRRVAARTVAERVADELGSAIGEAVGYTVRFTDTVGESTLVRVMTDGVLLNELRRDRELRRYDTLIIDEAHERSLNIDFLLGYLKQLLPRRPDLRVIVTSATIDSERFAAHFADEAGRAAPVFVVEGRSFPVEIRYRPFGGDDPDDPDDDRDQVRAVIDAVAELAEEGPGDVLVFLSGEREIHDVADALRAEPAAHRALAGVDVLPLYARLSAAEQHRIFEPHRGRRVVLSTNVAETSITVPGVRFVVDAGTARISRFSRRLKVQRLPIEPISRASASQRAGRCGRVAAGICIRLYSEDDFDSRTEFTEPEILRTNLASVILQMTDIGLDDVDRFPFVEPPDAAAVRDGYAVLDELGAFDEAGRLSAIGRRLARLPIDPRLARMVLESAPLGCVRQVVVIAAALSIQDVRERPRGDDPAAAERAAELHRRFDVEGSDLLSIVALWDYLRARQRELSGNQFRRMCRDEHLHYLRVREWRDLYSQLRQVAGQLGIRPGVDAAHPDHVHRAVLAGFLSHIGMRDGERREYLGGRGSRFRIAPGSVLGRRPPRWVLAAELVETDHLWARRLAAIQPEWAEPLAAHLVKRSCGDPWWDADRGRAMVRERVMLYGLPIVADRVVGLDRFDPAGAREMFIRHALMAGDWSGNSSGHYAFARANARFVERVRMLEARVRRSDLLDDDTVFAFYDERVDGAAVSARHFERWWRDARNDHPTLLDLGPAVLANRSGIELADYPDVWRHRAGDIPISYRYAPGTALDGAALVVPLTTLNQLDEEGLDHRLDWGIPGYRRELVTLLVRSLPKDRRRALIPLNDTVERALAALQPTTGQPLVMALSEALRASSGVAVEAGEFDDSTLPPHLRLHVIVVDDAGSPIDAGDDIGAIQARQAGSARRALTAATALTERRDITSWDLGRLERIVERDIGGRLVRAYPTLLDRGDSVALRVVDNEALQRRAMRGGVRRLLLMTAAPTPARVERSLDRAARLTIAASPIALADLIGDCIEAAVDAVLARYDLPFDAEAFGQIESAVRASAPQLAADALAEAADVLAVAGRVSGRLESLRAPAAAASVSDAAAHLARLIADGFVRRSGLDRLPDVHRYVRAIEFRLENLGGDLERDRRRIAEVAPIEAEVAAAVSAADRPSDALRDVVWMLEELRVAVFAQPLGVRGQVSAKRIRQALAVARAGDG